jgi:hypothetical protein
MGVDVGSMFRKKSVKEDPSDVQKLLIDENKENKKSKRIKVHWYSQKASQGWVWVVVRVLDCRDMFFIFISTWSQSEQDQWRSHDWFWFPWFPSLADDGGKDYCEPLLIGFLNPNACRKQAVAFVLINGDLNILE